MARAYFIRRSPLARMAKPLVVLVNGPAAGAGLGMALAGDIVIAALSAQFTVAYTAVGMTSDGGITWLLPKLIGLRRAQEMILTNRRVGADEAASIGLVTRVVSDETLADEGRAILLALSNAATGALGSARSLLLLDFGNGLETQMELEARSVTIAYCSADRPCDHARAAARPACVRSAISSRSNSANAAKNVKGEATVGGSRVDLHPGTGQDFKSDTARPEILGRRHQMAQVAAEPIEFPDDEGIAWLQRLQAGGEGRSGIMTT